MIDAARILSTPLTESQNVRWWNTPQGILLVSVYTADPDNMRRLKQATSIPDTVKVQLEIEDF